MASLTLQITMMNDETRAKYRTNVLEDISKLKKQLQEYYDIIDTIDSIEYINEANYYLETYDESKKDNVEVERIEPEVKTSFHGSIITKYKNCDFYTKIEHMVREAVMAEELYSKDLTNPKFWYEYATPEELSEWFNTTVPIIAEGVARKCLMAGDKKVEEDDEEYDEEEVEKDEIDYKIQITEVDEDIKKTTKDYTITRLMKHLNSAVETFIEIDDFPYYVWDADIDNREDEYKNILF